MLTMLTLLTAAAGHRDMSVLQADDAGSAQLASQPWADVSSRLCVSDPNPNLVVVLLWESAMDF